MISEKDRIRKEAKEILDKFSRALKKVDIKSKEKEVVYGGFREEGTGEECEPGFRKAMFRNAPNSEGDFIVAEKKKW